MRIYTKGGDLKYTIFTFPDGQPHFKLEPHARDFHVVTIETAICSPRALLEVLMANDVLRRHGFSEINLDIRYLMGARMDRAIDSDQPFTLELVGRIINSAGFTRVRILDVHSDVATRLIRNSLNVLPIKTLDTVMARKFWGHETSIVTPDKGAINRVNAIVSSFWCGGRRVQCFKKRDIATGALTGFEIENPNDVLRNCLIIDDICDGGGTFVGLAKELKEYGAKKVYLFVTHGIFSKGLPLEGIDKIFTTDSLFNLNPWIDAHHSALNQEVLNTLEVIPIKMSDL